MNYVAIDPGLKGAIALLSLTGSVEIHDMLITVHTQKFPRRKPKVTKRYDVSGMAKLVRLICEDWLGYNATWLLENVHSVPGFRSSPGASLDRAMGIWEGILGTLGIEINYVTPKDWKREFNLYNEPGEPKKPKGSCIPVAQELFPTADLRRPRARTDSADRADALLIAEYGRRTHGK